MSRVHRLNQASVQPPHGNSKTQDKDHPHKERSSKAAGKISSDGELEVAKDQRKVKDKQLAATRATCKPVVTITQLPSKVKYYSFLISCLINIVPSLLWKESQECAAPDRGESLPISVISQYSVLQFPRWSVDEEQVQEGPTTASQPPKIRHKNNLQASDENWPSDTHLFNIKGKHIPLLQQDPQIQAMLCVAIEELMGDLLFENAFLDNAERVRFSHDAVICASKSLHHENMVDRLINDIGYLEWVAKVVSCSWVHDVHFYYIFIGGKPNLPVSSGAQEDQRHACHHGVWSRERIQRQSEESREEQIVHFPSQEWSGMDFATPARRNLNTFPRSKRTNLTATQSLRPSSVTLSSRIPRPSATGWSKDSSHPLRDVRMNTRFHPWWQPSSVLQYVLVLFLPSSVVITFISRSMSRSRSGRPTSKSWGILPPAMAEHIRYSFGDSRILCQTQTPPVSQDHVRHLRPSCVSHSHSSSIVLMLHPLSRNCKTASKHAADLPDIDFNAMSDDGDESGAE